MTRDLYDRCCLLIEELELGSREQVIKVQPLTGGVASDIALVELPRRRVCVKFALPKLKVEADWFAPVHRNAAEYAWLTVAAEILPETAVRLFGRSEELHGFAMEFLEGEDVTLWKAALLAEAPDQGEAVRVADTIGQIQAASARPGFDASAFQNRDDFQAIRIEPYLSSTSRVHPALSEPIEAMAEQLYESAAVLVHGDVSPKNLLFRRGGPVLLDAECATMGDASFDPSFCLNHLVLKAVHLPRLRERLLGNVLTFWAGYCRHIQWEDPSHLEARVCRLLPMLMLARVDGKSPVEYLSEVEQERVRTLATRQIKTPSTSLARLVERLSSDMEQHPS